MFTPAFGQSFLWLVGSANYLYGIGLILIYLIPFRFFSRRRGVRDKKTHLHIVLYIFYVFFMLIFGFIAGATNENTSIALIAMVLTFMGYYKMHGIRVMPWMVSGLIGNITGCLFMLLSPGELGRMEGLGGINIMKMLKNTVQITLNIADYFSILLLIFTLIFSFYIYNRHDILITRKFLFDELDDFFITIV